MVFHITDTGKEESFEGITASYNGTTGKYGVYFPIDEQTVDVSLDDKDLTFVEKL